MDGLRHQLVRALLRLQRCQRSDAHPHPRPAPARAPHAPQLLYFGGEIQDLRRSSPGDMKAGTMLPLSSDMQPGSAGGSGGGASLQMAAVSYGSGPYGAGAGTNPFAGSV